MDKTTLCLSIHTLMGILGCFHFLALKNYCECNDVMHLVKSRLEACLVSSPGCRLYVQYGIKKLWILAHDLSLVP